jgi:hypothetical protein
VRAVRLVRADGGCGGASTHLALGNNPRRCFARCAAIPHQHAKQPRAGGCLAVVLGG